MTVCKASANHCSHCGAAWSDADLNYVPQKVKNKTKQDQSYGEDWNYWQEEDAGKSPRSSKSPRRAWNQRPKSPRTKGKGKQKGKGKGGKGKGKGASKNRPGEEQAASPGYTHGVPRALPPEPPWRGTQPAATLAPLPPPSTPPPLTPAEVKIQNWIAEMKKQPAAVQENLTPEMQTMMQEEQLQVGLKAADDLLTAATDLGTAREALDQARLGHHQLHVRWKDFLTAAVKRWQEYTSDFQKEEQEYLATIEQCKAALATARKSFNASQHTLGSEAELDCMVVEKETEAAKENKEENSGRVLQEGLNTMAANLVSLSQQAEAMVAQEQQQQAAKRQRVDAGEDEMHDDSKPSSGNALQPFPVRESHFPAPGKT